MVVISIIFIIAGLIIGLRLFIFFFPYKVPTTVCYFVQLFNHFIFMRFYKKGAGATSYFLTSTFQILAGIFSFQLFLMVPWIFISGIDFHEFSKIVTFLLIGFLPVCILLISIITHLFAAKDIINKI